MWEETIGDPARPGRQKAGRQAGRQSGRQARRSAAQRSDWLGLVAPVIRSTATKEKQEKKGYPHHVIRHDTYYCVCSLMKSWICHREDDYVGSREINTSRYGSIAGVLEGLFLYGILSHSHIDVFFFIHAGFQGEI